MKRARATTNRLLTLLIAASVALVPAQAAPRRDKALEAQLLAHITELASDAYEGREPGTEGEARTLRYLGKQWFEIGLQSGTNDPGHDWFTPVTFVGREPAASNGVFQRRGRRIYPAPDTLVAYTSGRRTLVEAAPLLFLGKGDKPVPPRGELAGRVALLLDAGRTDFERQNALIEAGASGVLTVLDGERSLDEVATRRNRSGYGLASEELGGDMEAYITSAGMVRALTGGGLTLAALEQQASAPDFAPRVLDISVTLEATTRETRINTHNLIGKLPGRHPDKGAVLLLAHWDHFGTCAEPSAEDRICNGAVDNASGLAALTEIARRLAKGPQMERDVYFLATTGEELGLLGARAFAEDPPLPLGKIVAAFNLDTIAIAPAGSPLAILGRGMTPLDAPIAAVAKKQRRKLVDPAMTEAINAYVRRQDGWALMQHDIPAVMVTSAYSDLPRMERFMDGTYHRPGDEVEAGIELGGAAEDVAFHVAMVRWFADPRRVPTAVK